MRVIPIHDPFHLIEEDKVLLLDFRLLILFQLQSLLILAGIHR